MSILLSRFSIIIVIIIFFSSCELFETETNNPPIDSDKILIGYQTIGPSGGEINLDSIIVGIPDGAFNENNEISIYVGLENDGFNEYANTSLFQLSGLPTIINKPMRLSIKYNQSIDGDTLIAIGELQYATSLDTTVYSYYSDFARDSSGYLVYNYPSSNKLQKSNNFQNGILSDVINFLGLNSYKKYPSYNNHFMIDVPKQNYNESLVLGDALEKAFEYCQTMGFILDRRDYPVNVIVKPLKNAWGAYSFIISIPLGKKDVTDEELISHFNKGRISMDLDLFTNKALIPTVAGHEFLHLVQNLYEFSSPNVEEEQKWLKEATSTWIMEKFTTASNYYPPVLNTRSSYILDGWQYSGRKYGENGYGLCPLIKGIEQDLGDEAILQIFDNIKAGEIPNEPIDPVEAILYLYINDYYDDDNAIPVFWAEILAGYLTGKTYPGNIHFTVLDNSENYTETVVIDDVNSNSTLKYSYHDLSGKIFLIKPGNISNYSTLPIEFKVDNDASTGFYVCKYKKGSEIEPISGSIPGLWGGGYSVINDAKPLFDAGYELVVIVTNGAYDKNKNYQGETEIELKIEIPEIPEYTDGSIFLRWPYEDWVKNWDSGNSKVWTDSVGYSSKTKYAIINMFSGTSSSSMTGTTFQQDYDTESSQGHIVGSITAIFNESFDTVLEYSETYSVDEGGGWTTDIELKAENVPRIRSGVYSVEGEDVCQYLTTYTRNSKTHQSEANVVSYRCSDKTLLELEFK